MFQIILEPKPGVVPMSVEETFPTTDQALKYVFEELLPFGVLDVFDVFIQDPETGEIVDIVGSSGGRIRL